MPVKFISQLAAEGDYAGVNDNELSWRGESAQVLVLILEGTFSKTQTRNECPWLVDSKSILDSNSTGLFLPCTHSLQGLTALYPKTSSHARDSVHSNEIPVWIIPVFPSVTSTSVVARKFFQSSKQNLLYTSHLEKKTGVSVKAEEEVAIPTIQLTEYLTRDSFLLRAYKQMQWQ